MYSSYMNMFLNTSWSMCCTTLQLQLVALLLS